MNHSDMTREEALARIEALNAQRLDYQRAMFDINRSVPGYRDWLTGYQSRINSIDEEIFQISQIITQN